MSCFSSHEFVRTGPVLEPLPENSNIRIFLTKKPEQKYTEIGLVRVVGNTDSYRISVAKKVARNNGANGIIPQKVEIIKDDDSQYEVKSVSDNSVQVKKTNDTWEQQKFILIRLK